MKAAQAIELIDKAGGTAAFGLLLGLDNTAGWRQRVHNWRTRGIPYKVLIEHASTINEIRRYRKPRTPKSPERRS
jgi:hypothetical protein